jgi:hypothetical protein
MKKLLVAAFVILCVSGCDVTYYSVTITNHSSKEVTFSYNDSPHTLASQAVSETQVKAHTRPPKDISVSGAMSVSMTAVEAGNGYLFEDAPSIPVTVYNTLPFAVRLAEKGNYLEDGNGSLFIDCPKQDSTKTAGTIYTKTPVFYLQNNDQYNDQYPVNFEYTLSDDGNMVVTVR